MGYPLITEYLRAVTLAADNLDKLAHLRPVLDSYGEPMRNVGAFAVVFKMQDPATGRCYALKCFTEEQARRGEAYRMIAEELSAVDSSYLAKVEYYDKELFVDSSCCEETEFPVLLMDWVDGVTMEQYVRENYSDELKMQWLCYRFCRMAAWLRVQPFAHGDIKPDNLIVREDGSLALVDYDGMFVPAMKGWKSPTLGTHDFSHPERTADDFDETIDDFALATTALSLKAISLDAELYASCGASDRLLLSAEDYRDLSNSQVYAKLQTLLWNKEFATLASLFIAAYSQKSLQQVSFRLFELGKPVEEEANYEVIDEKTENSDFHIRFKDGNCLYFRCIDDKTVAVVAPDCDYDVVGDTIPKWGNYPIPNGHLNIPNFVRNKKNYSVTKIGDDAFYECSSLQNLIIPDSVTKINSGAFCGCNGLQSIVIPDSVTAIGYRAFEDCSGLQRIVIPDSVTKIRSSTFHGCSSLQRIVIPDSVTEIEVLAFGGCSGLQSIVVDKKNPSYDSRNDCNAIIETSSNMLVVGCMNTIIPDSVTEIKSGAFYGCSGLQIIVIPDSVTEIGSSAFDGCSSLQSIVIPDSVTEIGSSAFHGCSSLQRIVIPDMVTMIGEGIFFGCSNLHRVVVDKNNQKYDSRNNCNAIIETSSNKLVAACMNTVIPDSVTEIGSSAFDGCSSLQSIVIPDSVTKIGNSAFSCCSGLQSIVIPDSVTEIGVWAFGGCSSLQSIVIPDSVTRIEGCAFDGCSGLQSIVVPDSVTEIGNYAFEGCGKLQSIDIPDSVTEIGRNAFKDCSSLQSIDIPDSVTEIGIFAFKYCSSLQSITIKNPRLLEGTGVDLYKVEILPTEEEVDYEVIDKKTENSDFHIRFKDGNCLYFRCIDDKTVAVVAPDCEYSSPCWDNYLTPQGNLCIPRVVRNKKDYSVTEIGCGAFRGCSGLQGIVIPDSVTEIGGGAFYGCSSMQSVVIPDSVTEIENGVFHGCSSLQRIVIPDSVIEIGDDVFEGCSNLQGIIVGKNNPSYDSRNDCNAIIETSSNGLIVGCMNTIIPDSVTEIRECAFSGCSSLQSIVIPDSVTEIGGGAFYGCSSLQSIVIPDSVIGIGNWAFFGCSSLRSIVIPNLVTKIGDYAFDGCSGLQGIVIPDAVTEIGEWAFHGCSGLRSIVIPDSVIKIGDYAFENCSSLQSVTIPDSVTEIGDDAFEGCSSLQSIKIKNPELLERTGVDLERVKIFD